ncbi:acyltransferase family protein [Arthrobacter sp. C152]
MTSLTGLRFFAALAVLLYHLRIYFTPIGDSLAVFGYGFTAVSFFFILSGFVLSWSQKKEVLTRRFYLHRIARIWPLHLLTMVLAIWAPALPTSVRASWTSAPFVATLTQAWIPASPFLNSFNGVSWSLSCEAFFYLMFPLLFRKLGHLPGHYRLFICVPVGSVILLMVLAAITSMPTADYLLGTMPLFRLGEFILGMCLASLMKAGWRPKFSGTAALGLLAMLTVGLLAASLVLSGMSVPVTLANVVMAPGFLAVIAAFANEDIAGKASTFASPLVVKLGQWSFALYLIHELVLRVFRPWTEARSGLEVLGLSGLVVVVAVATAGVLHELVEKPFERRLRAWAASVGGSSRYSTRGNE